MMPQPRPRPREESGFVDSILESTVRGHRAALDGSHAQPTAYLEDSDCNVHLAPGDSFSVMICHCSIPTAARSLGLLVRGPSQQHELRETEPPRWLGLSALLDRGWVKEEEKAGASAPLVKVANLLHRLGRATMTAHRFRIYAPGSRNTKAPLA